MCFSQDFFSYNGKHYQIPATHIPARPVQKPLPIYIAGHTEAMFRAAARHGYRVLSSGRVGAALLAEQYQIIKGAYRAGGVPLANAQITVRFCHITDSKEDGAALRRKRALPIPPCLEPAAATGGHAGYGAGR